MVKNCQNMTLPGLQSVRLAFEQEARLCRVGHNIAVFDQAKSLGLWSWVLGSPIYPSYDFCLNQRVPRCLGGFLFLRRTAKWLNFSEQNRTELDVNYSSSSLRKVTYACGRVDAKADHAHAESGNRLRCDPDVCQVPSSGQFFILCVTYRA